MTDIVQQSNLSETAIAPPEPKLPTSHEETIRVYRYGISTPVKSIKFDGTLAVFLKSELEKFSQVDLISIQVTFQPSAAGATIKAGIVEVGSSMSAPMAAMKPNGFSHTANDKNYGVVKVKTIIPEDLYTKQIKPISSIRPNFKFLLEVTGQAEVQVEIKLKHYNVIVMWGNFQ